MATHEDEDKAKSPWNSLELAKLGASLLTPIITGVCAVILYYFIANWNLGSIEHRALLERRLQIQSEIAAPLNRIFCFVEDVGTWKQDTPHSVIEHKRKVDSLMHANRSLWSKDVFNAYLQYIDETAFMTNVGRGQDAKIRTSSDLKSAIQGWDEAWKVRLTGKVDERHRQSYVDLQLLMATDLMQVKDSERLSSPSRKP